MQVTCYGKEFDIPDVLIDKYVKDFDCLPGGKNREGVLQIREGIEYILQVVANDPEALSEWELKRDFIKALAMKQALGELGILLDS